jgi:KUP system potassium uptake protein
MLTYLVARDSWGVSRIVARSLAVFFLAIDIGFFVANLTKIEHGGWFPLLVAGLLSTVLSTWKDGRRLLASRINERIYPFDRFMQDITWMPPQRVPGTAVFMTSLNQGTPPILLHNLDHYQVLHERVILLKVETSDSPYVPEDDRMRVEPLPHGFYRMTVRYGFAEQPDIPAALRDGAAKNGFPFRMSRTTFFSASKPSSPPSGPGMALWRERLFVITARNAVRATSFFRIPPERVVEIGIQVEL